MNFVRLAVTQEFIEELRRSSIPNPSDPLLALALSLPCLPRPPELECRGTILALQNEVFPERAALGRLSRQDQSDLVHLAHAIHHGVAGFITGEKAILRARESLRKNYGIDVLGVGEFSAIVEPAGGESDATIRGGISGASVRVTEVTGKTAGDAGAFLEQMNAPHQSIVDALAEGELGHARRQTAR